MLINHNQNMLCLDEFDILELRENADECDYLLLFRLKLKQRYALNNEHYTALKIRGHKHLCKSILLTDSIHLIFAQK